MSSNLSGAHQIFLVFNSSAAYDSVFTNYAEMLACVFRDSAHLEISVSLTEKPCTEDMQNNFSVRPSEPLWRPWPIPRNVYETSPS